MILARLSLPELPKMDCGRSIHPLVLVVSGTAVTNRSQFNG